MNSELLNSWHRSPGTASLKETVDVYKFLFDFKNNLEIYRSVFNEPTGYSVDSHIDRVFQYLDNFNK